jgi:tripartite-type tricarboxylate transporter receptor subunit TctC
MTRRRWSLLVFAAAGCLIGAEAVQAQSYPTKNVTITAPFAPSSASTLVTRLLADKLSAVWPNRVIVDPRPGGSGFVAIRAVKAAGPGGYDLLAMSDSHVAINPAIHGSKLPYDPERDFVPIAMIYSAPFFVAVSAAGPYQSVTALIGAAKANPGKITFGNPFVGSPPHLGAAMFEHQTGTTMSMVPFTEWNQLLLTLVQGDLDWTITSFGTARSFIQAKTVKLLALAAKQRLLDMPEVPTVEEAGGPAHFEVKAWVGLFAPRDTPPDIVRKLNADVTAQLAQPDMIKAIRNFGFEPATETVEQFADIMRSDTKKYGEIIARIGLKVE